MRGLMLADAVVVDPQALLHIGPVVLDDDIGALGELLEDLDALLGLEVERHGSLVAMQVLEIRAGARSTEPGLVGSGPRS